MGLKKFIRRFKHHYGCVLNMNFYNLPTFLSSQSGKVISGRYHGNTKPVHVSRIFEDLLGISLLFTCFTCSLEQKSFTSSRLSSITCDYIYTHCVTFQHTGYKTSSLFCWSQPIRYVIDMVKVNYTGRDEINFSVQVVVKDRHLWLLMDVLNRSESLLFLVLCIVQFNHCTKI